MIKYIGSKRVLVPAIVELVKAMPQASTVLDLFSGTSRVGHALKREGYRVMANDHNTYASTLGRCYVQADRDELLKSATKLVDELNLVPGEEGYFTRTFCKESHFFQPKNGRRVDGIRRAIEEKSLDPELKSVLLTSLMEAADRVDSTTGVQMAYLKEWAPRAHNDLWLRVPDILPRATAGKSFAYELDAYEAASVLEADVAYVDPPYNQHKYLGNYHIWETLVRWDEPVAYGAARKREDCKVRRSVFNSRLSFKDAISQLLISLQSRCILLSFNDEGYLSRETLEQMLAERGYVYVFEVAYPRYVGARIGIYNPRGEKVGRIGRLTNKEMIYMVTSRKIASQRRVVERLNATARVRGGQWEMSTISL